MKHGLLVAALALYSIHAAPAQAAQAPDPVAAIKTSYGEVAGWLARAAEQVPEAQYGYRPTKDVRSFAQLVAHVIDGNNYYCSRATGAKTEWVDKVEKTVTSKAALVSQLKASIARCTAAHTAANAANVQELVSNLAHSNLHYGNVITYLRLQGLVPPSS